MMITDQMIQLRRELLCLQELRLLVGEAGVLIGRGTLSIETKKKKKERFRTLTRSFIRDPPQRSKTRKPSAERAPYPEESAGHRCPRLPPRSQTEAASRGTSRASTSPTPEGFPLGAIVSSRSNSPYTRPSHCLSGHMSMSDPIFIQIYDNALGIGIGSPTTWQ